MRTALYIRIALIVALVGSGAFVFAADAGEKIPVGAKVYVDKMPDDFDTYLKAALHKKNVPVELVEEKDKAEYVITGTSESQKAGVAKKVLFLDWRSREEASITVANVKSGEIVFSYSVHKSSSTHGKQSTAEACAKHLKERVANK